MKNHVARFVLPALLGCAFGALPLSSQAAPGDVTAFNADLGNSPFATSPQIMDVLPFKDGKVLVGGRFQTVGGVSSPNLVLLNANGTKAATSFASVDSYVTGLLQQRDGRIIVAGSFFTVGGISKPRLARLFPDGSLDAAYSPPLYNGLTAWIALQADGKLLVSGDFPRSVVLPCMGFFA